MIRAEKYHIYALLAVFFVFFGIAFSAESPRVYFEHPEEAIAPSSEFEVPVFIDSDEPINVISAHILYSSDVLELTRVNTASSIIDVWVKNPSAARTQGSITLEGGMSNGFEGSGGLLAVLTFEARSAGTAQISLEEAEAYYADGSATPAPVSRIVAFVSVIEGGSELALDSSDTTPPQLKEVGISSNPVSGENVVVFEATDSDSGMYGVQARFRKGIFWSGLQAVEMPIEIPEGVWAVEVQAVDNHGNTASEVVYVPSEVLKKILYIILIGFALLWIKRVFKRKKMG